MAAPTFMQQFSRTVHTSASGIEIIRKFHIEPYEAHPVVVKALQGSVAEQPDGTWKRTAPARDPWITNCYCTEAVADPIDDDAWVSSDSIWLGANRLLDGLEKQESPRSGAMITAHYRPLITAWESSDPLSPDDERFDWLDPTFVPGIRQIPWPPGLNITREAALGTKSIPDELKQPLPIPISKVSIRRILVGKPPWELFGAMPGTVNNDTFPSPGSKAAGLLPAFAPRTLRMETPEVKNMIDSEGNRWFEIVLHFTWIMAETDFMIDSHGVAGGGPVTWNHIFTNGSIAFGVSGRTTWYEVYRGKARNIPPFGGLIEFGIPLFALKEGLLYTESDFMQLFKL